MTADRVLLIGRADDRELLAVGAMLRRLGVPVLRTAIEHLATQQVWVDPVAGVVRLGGQTIRPTAAWTRHLPRQTATGNEWSAEGSFAEAAQTAVVQELARIASTALPGTAPDQLRQLADAAMLGVRTPATLVSTEPETAPAAWSRVVLKALDRHVVEGPAGQLGWFHAQIWDRTSSPPWPRPGVPAVLQEYVEHEYEFRIYVVGDQVSGYLVEKRSPADLWLAPEAVTVRSVVVPAAVSAAAVQLATHWGLSYGAFDILMAHGEPVFLEVNPDGDWRWVENRTGQTKVTMSAARLLAELHRKHLRRRHRRQRDRLEPISFLVG